MINYGTDIQVIGNHTFEDILVGQPAGNAYAEKLGSNMYLIKTNIIIGDGITVSSITDTNVHVTGLGSLFQIGRIDSLNLGTLRPNGTTTDGCTLILPNLTLAYGFGNNNLSSNLTQSGSLNLYGSTIDAWCFWGFFAGDQQVVDIVDCSINGFGRVSGLTARLRNVRFLRAHGRYGVLATLGDIKELTNLSVGATLPDDQFNAAATYFNPTYSLTHTLSGCTFSGYTKLCYVEANPYSQHHYMRLVDPDIQDTFDAYWTDSKSTIEVYRTYKIRVSSTLGNIYTGAPYTLADELGNVVKSDVTDSNGYINELMLERSINQLVNVQRSYYTVVVEQQEFKLPASQSYVDHILFIGGSSCDCTDIEALIQAAELRLTTHITNTHLI